MWGFVDRLKREREQNDSKARWLKLSYVLVCVGLGLVEPCRDDGIVAGYV
jgi:hypothetical protein